MHTPKLYFSAVTAAALVTVGATALSATQPTDATPTTTPAEIGGDASEINPNGAGASATVTANRDKGPGTDIVPALEGGEYEGPGTDVMPSREVAEPHEGPGTDIAAVRDGENEGPGTASSPPTEAVYDCRLVEEREVCDTFGERDEGPGTR